MLDGVMLLWFILTALSLAFVIIDIRNTPENVVMKWGFVLLTAFTGPIGAFLYVLGCREPLPGLHEQYVSARWRQVLGSTIHCVGGDGVGIIAGAVIAAWITLPHVIGMAVEYLLGFGFGWAIFQALFMKDMAGGSYAKSLRGTFIPELSVHERAHGRNDTRHDNSLGPCSRGARSESAHFSGFGCPWRYLSASHAHTP